MLDDLQQFYSPKETQYLTHSFHPYPAKFIPQIAKALIQEYTQENDTILDPFCGSGTSLIEANLLKRNAIGIDLNPLACLISRVKTTSLNIQELRTTTKELMEEVYNKLKRKETLFDFITTLNPNIPDSPKREKWFQEHVLKELAVLKEEIVHTRKLSNNFLYRKSKTFSCIKDKHFREFCLVAFSSIIKDVSNASSLYRLTLADKKKRLPPLSVPYKFREKTNKMIRSLESYNQQVSKRHFVNIYEGDARWPFPFQKVDFILTHPPSFNFDFARSFKIHLWWLYQGKDPTNYIKELDKSLIGTKRVNSNIIYLNIDSIDIVINKIKQKRKDVAKALSKYFYDIKVVFINLYGILKENKYCCIQASDFILYGNTIRVADTFIELAQNAGFKLEKRIQRTVPKKALIFAKEDKVEEILVLRKVVK